MPDFTTFKLSTVIMHQIPSGRAPSDGSDPIQYSQAAIDLGSADKAFIQRKLATTLGGYARPVIEDKTLASPCPDIVRALIASSRDLIAHSSTLAHELLVRQKAVSPGGLVMTILGTIDGGGCLVVAKMEHQEGMQVELTTNSKGQRTYQAQYLHNLILGAGTRVFKAGIFEATGAQLGKKVSGRVVDDQQARGAVADYFVQYLGCQFVQRPDVLTENFMKSTQKFIAAATKGNPEMNAVYEIALLSEMQSNSGRVDPQAFARDHLGVDDRDEYLNQLRVHGVPTNSFPKDVSLVKSSIRRMRIHTERGADVLAPPEMFDDGSVTIEKSKSGSSTITVQDTVAKISGASGQKAQ